MFGRNAGKRFSERSLPPQTKASPRIFGELLSYLVRMEHHISFLGFAVGFIYLFTYFVLKEKATIGGKFFFKLTLKHMSPCGLYIYLV